MGIEAGHDEGGDGGGERITYRPGALNQAEGAGAMAGGPGLGDERGPGGPLAAHAEAKEDAACGKLQSGLGEGAEAGGEAVDEDAR